MSTKIRFRTDSQIIAEAKAMGKQWNPDWYGTREEWDRTPEAEPGDIWRIRWHADGQDEGPVAGYAICCPRCRRIHAWTRANNCGSRKYVRVGESKDGKEIMGWTCEHSGKSSCWTWTGSAEDGTLTASPSLFAPAPGECGWHGWLRNGVLKEC